MDRKPIPDYAKPVAEYIRKNVPRPKDYPKLNKWRMFRVLRFKGGKCPMGLIPHAKTPCPTTKYNFSEDIPGVTEGNILLFGDWWDNQTDPDFAMGQVWGPE